MPDTTDRHAHDVLAADLRRLADLLDNSPTLPDPKYPDQPQTIRIGLPTRLGVLHVANVMGSPFEDRESWQVATCMRVGSVAVEWFWHDPAGMAAAERVPA